MGMGESAEKGRHPYPGGFRRWLYLGIHLLEMGILILYNKIILT